MMIDSIHWLGHDTFRLDGSTTIYVDPWKLAADALDADVVLITHEHGDHFSPVDIAQIAGPRTTIVGPAVVTRGLPDAGVVTIAAGDTVTAATATVTAVPAYNLDKVRASGELCHPPEAGGVGYIIELDGHRVYHAGDTDAIPEMKGIECDVALLPVSGTYVMTAEEAARACDLIAARVAVPMHWGEHVGTEDDARRFVALCGTPATLLPRERE
jgi:L-ascorbate metabolism protein UlaG (beta-lactamase superfamily)